jgi:acyl-CoA thioesterase-1
MSNLSPRSSITGYRKVIPKPYRTVMRGLPLLLALTACRPTIDVAVSTVARTSPAPVLDTHIAASPMPSAQASPHADWLAYGDSIMQDAFRKPAQAWNSAWPYPAPGVIDAGVRGIDSAQALVQIDETLKANPGAQNVGLGFGTNDAFARRPVAAFHASLSALVMRVKAFGKRPLLCRIPYNESPGYEGVIALNEAVDEVTAEQGLPPGPDLYAWFVGHPEELSSDRLHMTDAGNADIQRLWAKAAMNAGF